MILPACASAHQHLTYAALVDPYPQSAPLWRLAAAYKAFGKVDMTTFDSAFEEEVTSRIARAWPDLTWKKEVFPSLIVWEDGPRVAQMADVMEDLLRLVGPKMRHVGLDGRLHTRPAKARLPLVLDVHISFSRSISPKLWAQASQSCLDMGYPNTPAFVLRLLDGLLSPRALT